MESKAAPDNFAFVDVRELFTRSHPFRLVLVDTPTPMLGMEFGEVVPNTQL